jgi:hypothetical protein
MQQQKTTAANGIHKRYSGHKIVVFDTITNIKNGERIVLFHMENRCDKVFCMPISLLEKDYRFLCSANDTLKKAAVPATESEYYDYALNILNHFTADQYLLKESVRIVDTSGITKQKFLRIQEDHLFLKSCLAGCLDKYYGLFVHCFQNGESLRKCAKAMNINRGSVDHHKKCFIKAFALQLGMRDKEQCRNRIEESGNIFLPYYHPINSFKILPEEINKNALFDNMPPYWRNDIMFAL